MTTRDYLKYAMQLEASIYEQGNVVATLIDAIQRLKNPTLTEKQAHWSLLGEYEGILGICSRIGVTLFISLVCYGGSLILSLFVDLFFKTDSSKALTILSLIIGISACAYIFFIRPFIEWRNTHHSIQRHNQAALRNNAAILQMAPQKIAVLERYLQKAQQNLSETRKLLVKHYAKNVIHPKYRNYVTVSMMYEYFDTGRCSSLLGHGGAYDTYEYEIRQNIIIGKLDVVISKLDQISDSQYALYQSIQDCNRNINRVNNSLAAIQNTNNNILECAEVAAYNSRITATNTTIMKNIMIYDHL